VSKVRIKNYQERKMTSSESLSSNDYLNKYLEPKKEELPNSDIPFFRDNFEWAYSGTDEVMSHNDGELSLSFDCQHLEDDFVEQLKQLMIAKQSREPKNAEKYARFFTPPMFILRDLQIAKSGGDNQMFGLKDYLATPGTIEDSGVLVFVNPADIDVDTDVINELLGKKVIFLSGNPSNLSTLLTLFHELGHEQTRDKNSEEMVGYHRGRPISKDEGRAVLEEERDAWAFALQTLRPYIRKESYEEVNKFIHDYALTNHSNHLRGQISPEWIAKFTKWIDDKVRKYEKEKRP